MIRCTNPYIKNGDKLTDERGCTIAVLIDGCFVLWEAGSWRPKYKKNKKLKQFNRARRAAQISKLRGIHG